LWAIDLLNRLCGCILSFQETQFVTEVVTKQWDDMRTWTNSDEHDIGTCVDDELRSWRLGGWRTFFNMPTPPRHVDRSVLESWEFWAWILSHRNNDMCTKVFWVCWVTLTQASLSTPCLISWSFIIQGREGGGQVDWSLRRKWWRSYLGRSDLKQHDGKEESSRRAALEGGLEQTVVQRQIY